MNQFDPTYLQQDTGPGRWIAVDGDLLDLVWQAEEDAETEELAAVLA